MKKTFSKSCGKFANFNSSISCFRFLVNVFSAPRHRSIHPVRARSEYANNKIVVSRRADRGGGKSNGCIVVAAAAAEEEKSGGQSGWKIASERDSEIYFGNWRGLMDFAGTLLLLFLWKTIPIPCPFLLLARTSRKGEREGRTLPAGCVPSVLFIILTRSILLAIHFQDDYRGGSAGIPWHWSL